MITMTCLLLSDLVQHPYFNNFNWDFLNDIAIQKPFVGFQVLNNLLFLQICDRKSTKRKCLFFIRTLEL